VEAAAEAVEAGAAVVAAVAGAVGWAPLRLQLRWPPCRVLR